MLKSFLFLAILFLTSCFREEDSSKEICTSNCTDISGKVYTTDRIPISGINFRVVYSESSPPLGSYSNILKKGKTDSGGLYNLKFEVKDNSANGYFSLEGDISKINHLYAVSQNSSIVGRESVNFYPRDNIGTTFYSLEKEQILHTKFLFA